MPRSARMRRALLLGAGEGGQHQRLVGCHRLQRTGHGLALAEAGRVMQQQHHIGVRIRRQCADRIRIALRTGVTHQIEGVAQRGARRQQRAQLAQGVGRRLRQRAAGGGDGIGRQCAERLTVAGDGKARAGVRPGRQIDVGGGAEFLQIHRLQHARSQEGGGVHLIRQSRRRVLQARGRRRAASVPPAACERPGRARLTADGAPASAYRGAATPRGCRGRGQTSRAHRRCRYRCHRPC